MPLDDIEKQIKEQRTAQANKNNLMGPNGKLGSILRALGHEIISGGLEIDDNYIDPYIESPLDSNDWRNADDILKHMPTIDFDQAGTLGPNNHFDGYEDNRNWVNCSEYNIGYFFDGLSRGLNLEIKYLEEEGELTCKFNGFLIYKETKGDLEVYIPGKWEEKIDKLYESIKGKVRKIKESDREESYKDAARNKQSWLTSLLKRWGFKPD